MLDNSEVVRLDEADAAQEAVRGERLLEGAPALRDQAADLVCVCVCVCVCEREREGLGVDVGVRV